MKKLLSVLLAALTCVFFVACAPMDIDKAEDKMEKAGYEVTVIDGEAAEKLADNEDAEAILTATKGDLGDLLSGDVEMVTAVLFESLSAAWDFYQENKDEAEEDDDTVYKMNGKWVISGTEDAVKEFLKIF